MCSRDLNSLSLLTHLLLLLKYNTVNKYKIFCPRRFCPRGYFVLGDFVLGGILSRGFCPGGLSGGICPDTVLITPIILTESVVHGQLFKISSIIPNVFVTHAHSSFRKQLLWKLESVLLSRPFLSS